MAQHDSSIQEQSTLLSALGWREHTRGCASWCNIEIWVHCFLCGYNSAIESQRRFEHPHFRNHVVALNTKNSNELLRQFLDQQGPDVVQDLLFFFEIFHQRIPLDNTMGRMVSPLPFVDLAELFAKVIHQTRLCLWLRRMSFLNA